MIFAFFFLAITKGKNKYKETQLQEQDRREQDELPRSEAWREPAGGTRAVPLGLGCAAPSPGHSSGEAPWLYVT